MGMKNLFKIDLDEYGNKRRRLSDYLPWAALVAPGTILNKDGSFLKIFSYRGRDLESATMSEMVVTAAQINNILKGLTGDWAMFVEAKREKSREYFDRQFPDLITAMIDTERKRMFSSGNYYESTYYFTLQYYPPKDKYDRMEKIFIETMANSTRSEIYRARDHLKDFLNQFSRVFRFIGEIMSECRELTDDETLTYLHSCISLKNHIIKAPKVPVLLDSLLYDTPFVGGMTPMMGGAHYREYVGVVSVMGFPDVTCPGIFDDLNRQNLEYRWVTRYLPMDKNNAKKYLSNLRTEWFSERKSLLTLLKELGTKSESAMVEEAALGRYEDVQQGLVELEDNLANFGYFKTTVVMRHADERMLREIMQEFIEKPINRRGFATRLEDMNAESAWLGTIPGMVRDDVRKPVVNSLNLTHMLPISAVWAGDKWNKHLNAPPLMQTKTEGSTPFRLNLHIDDVGNTMVVGPIGSGKSVLLNMLEAQFRGYENAQVYIFDKGGSSRVLTAGVGGDFYDLANEDSGLSFQPLVNINEESELIWANDWLQMIYEQEGVTLTPQDKKDIWNALNTMAKTSPQNQRRLGAFYLTVQNQKLKDAIEPFIFAIENVSNGGPYGRLFDADSDSLTYGRWQAFEMGELMNKKKAIMPTLQYLFHVIEKRCDGAPTMIVLDECWVFLDNPLFEGKIREWFKTMRKNNVIIVFATQNLQDIGDSNIAPAIIENCFTKIFLPNASAINESDAAVYQLFNINEKERWLIAKAISKREYYYRSPKGSRKFELALGEFEKAYVASASQEDQAECRRILREYPAEEFNLHWLEYKGLQEYKRIYEQLRGA